MLGYLKSKAKGLIDQGVEVIMALVIVGVIAGAGTIALGSLYTYTQTGTPSALLNATVGGSINNSMLGVVNLTQQLGTVGTVAAVGLVILVIVSAFAIFLFKHRE